MKNVILVIVITAVSLYIFLVIKKNRESSAPQYVEQAVTLSPKQAEPEPQPPPVKYPVAPTEPEMEPTPAPEPLPALDESDDALFNGLAALSADIHWQDLFLPTALVRRFVVTVDNMTADKMPQKYRFVPPLPGNFQVQKIGDDELAISKDNYGRYAAYIRLVETIDMNQLAFLYRRFYPLFQQAYEELGYPGRYFNDRLIQVIDHLLATPQPRAPVALKQPKVYYVFADPELEAMSAGQKMLIRIGPNNAASVKIRLRELRTLLTGKN